MWLSFLNIDNYHDVASGRDLPCENIPVSNQYKNSSAHDHEGFSSRHSSFYFDQGIHQHWPEIMRIISGYLEHLHVGIMNDWDLRYWMILNVENFFSGWKRSLKF